MADESTYVSVPGVESQPFGVDTTNSILWDDRPSVGIQHPYNVAIVRPFEGIDPTDIFPDFKFQAQFMLALQAYRNYNPLPVNEIVEKISHDCVIDYWKMYLVEASQVCDKCNDATCERCSNLHRSLFGDIEAIPNFFKRHRRKKSQGLKRGVEKDNLERIFDRQRFWKEGSYKQLVERMRGALLKQRKNDDSIKHTFNCIMAIQDHPNVPLSPLLGLDSPGPRAHSPIVAPLAIRPTPLRPVALRAGQQEQPPRPDSPAPAEGHGLEQPPRPTTPLPGDRRAPQSMSIFGSMGALLMGNF